MLFPRMIASVAILAFALNIDLPGIDDNTLGYILIVAGIIVAAVGDELVLHHPGGHTDVKTAAVIIGGASFFGGVGTVSGTLIGALFIGLLPVAMAAATLPALQAVATRPEYLPLATQLHLLARVS